MGAGGNSNGCGYFRTSGKCLAKALSELDLPSQPGIAYIAGEARSCQAIRDHLMRERGWSRRHIVVKPFWTPGKRGLE
jgi:NADPH-dependent ferric siderophore reductase